MNHTFSAGMRVAALAVATAVVPAAQAAVVTFDDLGSHLSPIPNGYGGLNWSNFGVMDTARQYSQRGVSGYTNGTVSGNRVAFNEWGSTAVASSGSTFSFNGAYLTGAWNNALDIEVNGYLGGRLLYSRVVTVDSTGPTWFSFNYVGIDSVAFSSYGGVAAGYPAGYGNHFAMDNLTYNAPVPIPAALWLFGTGLLGLVGIRIGCRTGSRDAAAIVQDAGR